jgi:tRNA 5-methylaminomethyl-2-thiouridine biosynthesis bifunctional protein
VGFAVEKNQGFGKKRERLEATFREQAPRAVQPSIYPYARPTQSEWPSLALASLARAWRRALTRRGIEVVVLEAARELGAGASGNPAALVMPRLDRGGVLSEVYLAAYLHAVALYEDLGVFEARAALNSWRKTAAKLR